MRTIFFDESGNTGRQLGDLNQPIFVLGSCDFTPEQCDELLTPLRSRQAAEIHFKKIRKTAKGQDKIIELLSSSLVSSTHYKSCIFHKRFMLLCKFIDDLVENHLNSIGIDLYSGGLNRALSNMLYYSLPTLCGEESFDIFLSLYYDMVLSKREEDILAFYDHIQTMRNVCKKQDEDFSSLFNLIIPAQDNVLQILEILERSTFNPAIPAFFNLCVVWGTQYKNFDAICDDSAPVENQKQFFDTISNINNSTEVLGYGPNQFELPLKLNSLSFSSSHDSDGIQVADIITGAVSYYINKQLSGDINDEFYIKLNKINKLDELIGRSNWPTLEVTPEELDHSQQEAGRSPIDMMTNYMLKNKVRYKK